MIEMTAKADFTNPRIKGPRDGGAVLAGESFTTDWLHAKELAAGKLATPDDPKALDREPTEAVAPSHGLSVGQHATINARRAGAESAGEADRAKAAAAAQERVTTARKALEAAERAVKDRPGSAAKARLAEAQAEYDAAETEAKTFTTDKT